MEFFDCHVVYGVSPDSRSRAMMQVPDKDALVARLDEIGIARALVRREEQSFAGVAEGNEYVSRDCREDDRLWGLWTLVPPHTRELPEPENILDEMRANRIVGWTVRPEWHRYSLHPAAVGVWLELAEREHVPVFVSMSDVDMTAQLSLLERYPELTLVCSPVSVWPDDRWIRPLLTAFPNTFLDISIYFSSDGLAELAETCGADRLLFGTGFHRNEPGGPMMMVRHSPLTEQDKTLVAGENLRRIVRRAGHDS